MHRAEATDVANAVLDGVDGILLGAETLRGKYPVQTVQTILAICRQAEKAFDHNYHFEHLMAVNALHTPLIWDLKSLEHQRQSFYAITRLLPNLLASLYVMLRPGLAI